MFHEPAVDAIWGKLYSLDPLIKLLPRGLWSGKRCHVVGPSFLIFYTYPNAEFPLLPNLTTLVWTESSSICSTHPVTSILKHLVGKRVTDVTVICWPLHNAPEVPVLSELSRLCPNVTSFTAFIPASSSHHVGTIAHGWTKLRTFRGLAMPQPIMDQVVSRASLQSLSIELDNSTEPAYIGNLPESVHTFSLDGSNAEGYVRYLSDFYGSPQTLRLRVCVGGSTVDGVADLLHMLPEHVGRAALHDLSIELTSSYARTPSIAQIVHLDLKIFYPLLAFRSLRTVDLDFFGIGGLDDAAFGAIAQAWPNLKHLALGTGDISRTRPRVTMNGLIALLTHCPSLASLHLVFDATVLPPEELLGSFVNTCITEITVGHSPIRDVQPVIGYLAQLLPRLRRVVSSAFPVEYHKSWLAVQRILSN
ncbi:hypothetical protein ID866_7815 [Astraeus odoratus]|nr:hypothetical protein ID866_7815 [Astraeus odoratus]